MFYNNNMVTIARIIGVTAFIGLIAGIVALFLFLPEKNREKYKGFLKYLYDFLNFDKFWFISIIKVLFISLATACILGGFICLFINFLTGLGIMLAGIMIRITLEVTMVIMNIGNNVSQINDKLSDNDSDNN